MRAAAHPQVISHDRRSPRRTCAARHATGRYVGGRSTYVRTYVLAHVCLWFSYVTYVLLQTLGSEARRRHVLHSQPLRNARAYVHILSDHGGLQFGTPAPRYRANHAILGDTLADLPCTYVSTYVRIYVQNCPYVRTLVPQNCPYVRAHVRLPHVRPAMIRIVSCRMILQSLLGQSRALSTHRQPRTSSCTSSRNPSCRARRPQARQTQIRHAVRRRGRSSAS